MTPTEDFITILSTLKTGELGLLRAHAGKPINESVLGFDLFTGVWWPIRQRSPRAPRREVAWLVAKLFASVLIPHSPGQTLPGQLRRCQSHDELERKRFQQRFDRMLALPIVAIEPACRWALGALSAAHLGLDWVRLTDDLSFWDRESTRLGWAEEFLNLQERK